MILWCDPVRKLKIQLFFFHPRSFPENLIGMEDAMAAAQGVGSGSHATSGCDVLGCINIFIIEKTLKTWYLDEMN
jgi:hypothetical protein